jgi:hypothetical protein
MRKLLLSIVGLLLSTQAWAVDPATLVGNVNYTVLTTDVRLIPNVALTANRTWTLPAAAATQIGQGLGPASGPGGANALEVTDAQGNIGGANSCIIIAPASGDTINGSSSSITFCSTYGRMIIQPLTGTNWFLQVLGPGQFAGTTTNDNAQAGFVGEFMTSGLCPGSGTTATVTITIAAPGVVTWTAHGLTGACPVVFTTSGALPTGITSGTTYYVVPGSITPNTFTIATTVANALAGTAITTSGSQSGTQTGTDGVSLTTNTAATITGLRLTAGDWDCRAMVSRTLGASTSITVLEGAVSSAATTISTQGGTNAVYMQTAANVTGVLGRDQYIGPSRISLAATTNEFLVIDDTFTVSTDVGFGTLECRRVR